MRAYLTIFSHMGYVTERELDLGDTPRKTPAADILEWVLSDGGESNLVQMVNLYGTHGNLTVTDARGKTLTKEVI